MIEIYVVDERDLKYILIFMVCFVINYNNFCMFNLYFLSVIKNYDILLMVFEKKIIKLYIISLINSNIQINLFGYENYDNLVGISYLF